MKRILLVIFLLAGCASEMTQDERWSREMEKEDERRYAQACADNGGVLYRRHRTDTYACVDRKSVMDALRGR